MVNPKLLDITRNTRLTAWKEYNVANCIEFIKTLKTDKLASRAGVECVCFQDTLCPSLTSAR